MTLSTFIKNVSNAVKGTDDDPPSVGDEDWLYWVETANRKKNEMYDDVSANWASAYDTKTIGTIAAGTEPSFSLDDTDDDNPLSSFIAPAEKAFVIRTDGNKTYLDVIKPQERDRTCQEMYIAGLNPRVLHFNLDVLSTDNIVGGTLKLPAYWRPADIDPTAEDAIIPCDDPNWLVMATAAQVAFNDITYEDKFDDLNGQANVLYHNMQRANRRPTRGSARKSRTQVKRIRGFR